MGVLHNTAQGRKYQKKLKDKTASLRKEISRKASMANKRISRLEKNNLTSTPAYSNWVEYGGGVKFSVKGKDYNQLQAELARVNSFLDNATSTVRGTNATLKRIAKTTGITYKNIGELQTKTKQFFELASKTEQYLRNSSNMASAIGYQKIWEVINTYIKESQLNLDSSIKDIDSIVKKISELAETSYMSEKVDTIYNVFNQL